MRRRWCCIGQASALAGPHPTRSSACRAGQPSGQHTCLMATCSSATSPLAAAACSSCTLMRLGQGRRAGCWGWSGLWQGVLASNMSECGLKSGLRQAGCSLREVRCNVQRLRQRRERRPHVAAAAGPRPLITCGGPREQIGRQGSLCGDSRLPLQWRPSCLVLAGPVAAISGPCASVQVCWCGRCAAGRLHGRDATGQRSPR